MKYFSIALLFVFFLFATINTSLQAQPNFTAYSNNPVLQKGQSGQWDSYIVFLPKIFLTDSMFYLFYVGNSQHPSTNPNAIGYAYSSDGYNYTKYNNNPILAGDGTGFDSLSITTGAPLMDSDSLVLYYTCTGDLPGHSIGRAKALHPSGPWIRYYNPMLRTGSTGEWDSGYIAVQSVLKSGNNYFMFYSGSLSPPPPGVGNMRIGMATSIDGINWIKYDDPNTTTAPYAESDPVLRPGSAGSWDDDHVWMPSVLENTHGFEMFYNGGNQTTGGIGYATSSDGINWLKSANNPIYIRTDDPYAISSGGILEVPSVALKDTTYFMYYDYGLNVGEIGLATATRNPGIINIPNDYNTIQEGINAAIDGDTVLVADSTYYENINFKGKAITVASYYLIDGDSTHIDNTIIDGSNPSNPDSGSVVSFVSGEDTNSVLYGFTITNGTGLPSLEFGPEVRSGGGIVCYNSGASIISNKIIYNTINHNEPHGGGIGVLGLAELYVNVINNEIKHNVVNGSSSANAGGLLFANAGGNIIGNKINNNSSICTGGQANGGGINLWSDLSLNPHVTIKDNKLQYNLSESSSGGAHGGGVVTFNIDVMMTNNDISVNELNAAPGSNAFGGGALIQNMSGASVINDNRFVGNFVENGNGHGGGLNLWGAIPTFERNIITNNSGVVNGGGIQLGAGSNVSVNNCIISNNYASSLGGGVYSFDSNPSILNSTITYNEASLRGGGVRAQNCNTTVMNSIVWGNIATYVPGISYLSGSMNVAYSNVQGGYTGSGNINLDPLFAPDTMHISSVSPCISAGIDSFQIGSVWYFAPEEDFESDPRPWPANTAPDMGADEHPFGTGVILVPEQYPSIQAGINAADSGDVVLVRDSIYYENINFKGKAITVASHFYIDGDTSHISNTIIDGSNPSNPDSGTVVSFISREDTTSVLCGFTITGGTGTWFSEWNGRAGGGIGVYRSGAKIINNIIEHNTCRSTRSNTNAWGGGIDAFADTTDFSVVIENNIIQYDTVYTQWYGYGGGLGVEFTAGRVINNTIKYNACFSENRNSIGGGVYISQDTSSLYKSLNFTNNSIIDNLSRNYNSTYWSQGGGVMTWGCGISIKGNIISDNRIRTMTGNWCTGAGLYCSLASEGVSIEDNTIINNNFTGGSCRGGGICLRQACPDVFGNNISFNHATNGGGIFLDARLTSESMENQTIHIRSKRKSNTNKRSNEKHSGNNFIIKNTLSHNTATEYGGGMGLYYGDVVLMKNIIRYNNAAIAAGGIEFGRSNSKAINNTIVNNSAGSAGGGGIVCYNNSDPDIINTIVWDNSAIGAGAQVNIYSADCDPNFDYCNIAGDSSGFGGAGSGSNYSGTYQNCLDADPLMVDSVLAVGDTMFCCLSSGSPCIDAGHPSHSCNDLNGTRNDIGAHGGQVDSLYYHLTGLFNDPENKVIPQKFVLKQNYPNPFNPVTTIEFSIPKTEQVKLIVYNMLGQEVETLVFKKLTSGNYKYIWNAEHLASGVYFYKLEAGNYVKAKKLILLK